MQIATARAKHGRSRRFDLEPGGSFCQSADELRMRFSFDAGQDDAIAVSPREFPDTRWSRVALAGSGDCGGAEQALDQLCQSYWQPIYGFLRRKGYSPHDAEDLTQQFFFRLLQRNSVANADRAKGRFRNFLLGALDHFLTDELRKSTAQKRGGNTMPFAGDFSEAEERYLQEPSLNLTPDEVYDRRWAATLLQRAFDALSAEFEEAGEPRRFETLKPFLARQPEAGEYDRVAQELNMTGRAVSAAIYRLRQRYRQLVRSQVAETVAASNEIEAELAHLFE